MKRHWYLCVLLATTDGCVDEYSPTDDEADPSDAGWTEPQLIAHAGADDLDILLVVDNSLGLADAWVNLDAWTKPLADALDRIKDDREIRLGITTAAAPHPLCPGSESIEAGRLMLRSCRDHLDDFVAQKGSVIVDRQAAWCEDRCSIDALSSGAIDPDTRWLTVTRDGTDVESAPAIEDVLSCVVPQGIDGCRFSSTLEALHGALTLPGGAANHEEHAFLRLHADLAIVLITPVYDCSAPLSGAPVDDPRGVAPGVCWRAGVECYGEPPLYRHCEAVDQPSDASDQLSLYSITRYVERLRSIAADKRSRDPSRQVDITIIGGVPEASWGSSWPTFVYWEPSFDSKHRPMAMVPNCQSSDDSLALYGYPHARLRDVLREAELPGRRQWLPVCHPWSSAPLVERVRRRPEVPRACLRERVADIDPQREGTQPECIVDATGPSGTLTAVSPCVRDVEGNYVHTNGGFAAPESDRPCYVVRGDATGETYDPFDDILRDDCPGWPHAVAIDVHATAPARLDRGTQVRASCRASPFPLPGRSATAPATSPPQRGELVE